MIASKQNPFSLYDFLGYLIPGAIFLYISTLLAIHFQGETTFDKLMVDLKLNKIEIYIPFVLLAYVAGHFLSFISSITIERYVIWAYDYPSRFILNLQCNSYWSPKHKREKAVRLFVGLLLFPIPILDLIFGRGLYLRNQFSKRLDDILTEIIKTKVISLIQEQGEYTNYNSTSLDRDHDFFRYVYHYVVQNSQSHLPKMQNYVALYGFLRTITLILIILTWVFLIQMAHQLSIKYILGCDIETVTFSALTFFSIASYFGYMAFMKFYRRFSLEALMALSVVYKHETKEVPIRDKLPPRIYRR